MNKAMQLQLSDAHQKLKPFENQHVMGGGHIAKPHFVGTQTFNQSFDDKYGVMTPGSPIFNKSMNNTGRNQNFAATSALGKAGASMMSQYGGKAFGMAPISPSQSSSKQLPFSFTTTLESIEEEIRALQAEVSTTKKETFILQSEEATAADVARSQTNDINRYLNKEISILQDMINKQHDRQGAEFKRLWRLCEDFQRIRENLDQQRSEATDQLDRVQNALGIETDSHEPFQFGSKNNSPNATMNKP